MNNPAPPTAAGTFFDLTATDIHGHTAAMSQWKGMKVLVVNVASECGFTPQYAQLEELHAAYKDKGLVVVGFPCDQFGGQEPGTEAEIEAFCRKNYGVTFPLMSKVEVKGPNAHPVYKWLTQKALNGKMDVEVKWNFQKFLINEDGSLATTVASATSPLDDVIIDWIEGRR
jgi:glutathione peroxidase